MKKYIFSSPSKNGQIALITYFPEGGGGEIFLGSQLLPWTWETTDSYGMFEILFITEGVACYIINPETN